MTNKCKAKTPANCRFHGTLENRRKNHLNAMNTYGALLGKLTISAPKDKPQVEKQIQAAKEKIEQAQIAVDAHDEVYKQIVNSINRITEKAMNENETELHIQDQNLWAELKARKIKADINRAKTGEPIVQLITQKQAAQTKLEKTQQQIITLTETGKKLSQQRREAISGGATETYRLNGNINQIAEEIKEAEKLTESLTKKAN